MNIEVYFWKSEKRSKKDLEELQDEIFANVPYQSAHISKKVYKSQVDQLSERTVDKLISEFSGNSTQKSNDMIYVIFRIDEYDIVKISKMVDLFVVFNFLNLEKIKKLYHIFISQAIYELIAEVNEKDL